MWGWGREGLCVAGCWGPLRRMSKLTPGWCLLQQPPLTLSVCHMLLGTDFAGFFSTPVDPWEKTRLQMLTRECLPCMVIKEDNALF